MRSASTIAKAQTRPKYNFGGRILRYCTTWVFLPLMVLVLALGQILLFSTPAQAATNTTINFQARILNLNGSLAADGNYHVEFKIYNDVSAGATAQGVCSGNCQWVETRTGANVVRVVNGYVSVNLGSVTAFPATMPWDQDLYVTMRVGGAGGGPVWDTEMTNAGNRMKTSSAPYAFRAAQSFNVFSDPTSTASTNTNAIAIQTGNATGLTSNSGNVTIDSGTATGTTGVINVAGTNASALNLGRSGMTTAILGATLNGTTPLLNFAANAPIGTAAATVDARSSFVIPQTSVGIALTLPSPTSTTAGRIVYVANTGTQAFTLNGTSVAIGTGIAHIWNGTAWALVGGAGGGSTTLQQAYDNAVGGIVTVTAADGALRVRDAAVTFGNANIFSVQNNAGAVDYLAVQGDGDVAVDTNTLFVDATNNRVGIGTAAPTAVLQVTNAAPAIGAGATGTAQILVANLAGGIGGSTTIATSGTGGAGGGLTYLGGNGGTADSALTASTGGAGGATSLTSGTGGAAAVAGVGNNSGGNGGAFTLQSGAGGAATGATSGNNTGGSGGTFTLQAGTGGTATTGSGNLAGGAGGVININGGTGGIGTTSGGNGGAVTLQGGLAAAMPGAAGGAVTIAGRAGSATGSGGAGGALSLTAGAAGGDNSVNRAGGAVTISAGASRGATAGGAITVTAGSAGSNLTVGANVTGAASGGISFNAGNGGIAPNATTLSTGGAAGGFTVNGGIGGAASVGGAVNNTGGGGGTSSFTGGTGGAANGATSGINTGGTGGAFTFQGGTGGAATTGSGSLIGGTGGALTFSGGTGGLGTTSGGNGGAVTIQGGTAANMAGAAAGGVTITGQQGSNTGSGGNGGGLSLQGGNARGDGTVARAGGVISLTAGNSVGASAGGTVTLSGGSGGVNAAAGTASGGASGGITFNGGNGGTAPNATVASTGGASGGFTVNGGTGGTAAVAGTGNNTGGAGGAFALTSGTGGNATGATSGTNTGGVGGAFNFTAGNGGNATTGTGTLQGGNGGSLAFSAGRGGTGTATGVGGDITFLTTPTTAAQVERLRVTNSGYVGIGTGTTTSLPNARLTVVTENTTTSQIKLRSARVAIVANDVIGGLDFDTNDSNLTAPGATSARVQAIATATHTGAVNDTALVFSTSSGVTLAERWRIGSTGELQGNGASTIRANTGNLTIATLTSGNVIINGAGTFEVQDDINITSNQFTNSASTVNTAQPIANAGSVAIGVSAATTVDVDSAFILTQTTAGTTKTLHTPTNTTAGRLVYVTNSPSSTTTFTLYSVVIPIGGTQGYIWNGSAWTALNVAGAGSGVTTVGAIDSQAKSANGAVISGSTIYLQTADLTNVGLVSTTTQSIAGAKTFSDLLTGSAGLDISGAITNINDSSNFNTNINTGSSTGTLTIGNPASTTVLLGTTSINTSGIAGTDIGNATGTLAFTGATTLNGSFIQSGAVSFGTGTGAVSLNGATSVTGSNTLTVGTGLTTLGGGLAVTGTSTFTGNLIAGGSASGVTATATATSGVATTTINLTAGAFADNDVVFINNAGQDYYTRIVSGGGTASLTVSPAVDYDASVTIERYSVQNIGATSTDYSTQANRFFQGYFLGGVVVGSGSTTLSDGNLSRTTGDIVINPGAGGVLQVNGTINATTITGDGSGITSIDSSAISGATITGIDASNISAGTLNDSRLSSNVALLNGSASFVSSVTAASFAGDGSALTALNGSNVATGTVADARLSTNIAQLSGAQIFSGSKTFNAGITIGAAQTITIDGQSFSTLDGTGLTNSSGSLSVLYGSSAGSAVQGNTTITCPTGTGNLTGGGDTITLGSGGTCSNITTNNAASFSTSVTSPLFTGAGAVTVSSGGAGDLTLDSASNVLVMSDATLRRIASGTTTVELNDSADTTLSIFNTDGASVANISVEGLVSAASLSGDGSLITAINGTSISTGTVADGRLSSNVSLLDLAQSFSALKTFGAGATITTGQTFTIDGEGFTDLTGNGLTLSGSSLAVVYGSLANTAVEGNTGITITAGTGISGGGSITLGTGGTVSLDIDYGSLAGTAVQGNTTLTCPSGTGNLTGGGTSITLGSGGSCGAISTNNAVAFTTSVTSPIFTSSGAISLTSGGANTVTVDSGGASTVSIAGTNATAVNIGRITGVTTVIAGDSITLSSGAVSTVASTVSANSVTTGTAMQISATSLTTGSALDIVGPGSRSLLRVQNNTADPLDDQRVIIGQGGLSLSKPDALARDQLYVFGRINYSWNMYSQDFVARNQLAQATADAALYGAVFDEATGAAGGFNVASVTGQSGTAILDNPTSPAANENEWFGTGGVGVTERSLNPVFEARVLGTANTDHRIIAGFADIALNGANSADTNQSANEIFFRKNQAATVWQAVTRTASGVETTTNTAIATNAYHTLRIEVDNVTPRVLFVIDGTVVATHTTGLPAAATRLGWYIGNALEAAANRATNIDYVRVWSDDPPEDSIVDSINSSDAFDVTVPVTPESSAVTCLSDESMCPFVRIAADAIYQDSSDRDSLAINKTAASGNFIRLQRDASDVLVVSNNGGLTISAQSGEGLTIRNGNASVFSVNPAGKLVRIGQEVASAEPILFVLSASTVAEDPAGTNGAQYYNASTNRFRCFENGEWRNCIGGATNAEFSLLAQKATWTNVPVQPNELLGNEDHRAWIDMSFAREFRATYSTSVVNESAECSFEYSVNNGTDWASLTDTAHSIGFTAVGLQKSDWYQLRPQAKGEVLVRAKCTSTQPDTNLELGNIKIQLR